MERAINKALILAPHTDDGELGCGAVISNFIRKGIEVHYVAFSICEESVSQRFPKDILAHEVRNATRSLGIPEENMHILGFKVRNFFKSRQDILEELVEFSKEIDPDLIFSPSIHDVHQDHQVIAQESIRCFKHKTIFQYHMPWNNMTFNNQLFIEIEECDKNAMVRALNCYESQSKRMYIEEEYIHALLLTTGAQVGVKYAQVFEVPRMVIRM